MSIPIPIQQQAAVVEDPGDNFKIVLRHDIQVGEPGPEEILVQLTCTGLCGSEVRAVSAWAPYNPIIGHEGVGRVVKAGTNVSSSLLGQRVGVKWLYNACTECSICKRGFFHHCPKQLNTSRHVPGTLQQYVVADARFVTMIPENLSDEIAAPLLCAGLTMAGALAHLDQELGPGDWIAVSGSGGGLGHIGVQIAARVKKLRVIAIDRGDEKRKISMDSGAEAFIDFKTEDVGARVLELTGEGAHATIVVPGNKEAFQMAPMLVRNMATIVCVGLPQNQMDIPISATLSAARGLTIKGSSVGTEEKLTELLQLAVQGVITPEIEVFDFAETPRLVRQLTKDQIKGRAVVKIPMNQ
ncbi:hypothetical protein N7478_008893 [Penicillium angulare]|uniref:uncharacterized protein n=1 Tax=Penicillium angulare TaxID=116970 RepID=UPI002541C1FD|nr:uncharacterized protein N7478_008893 [Penicillium angulare]KAJ5273768.1 hypothetical protein N7478_008893 [Penicillium angulare]